MSDGDNSSSPAPWLQASSIATRRASTRWNVLLSASTRRVCRSGARVNRCSTPWRTHQSAYAAKRPWCAGSNRREKSLTLTAAGEAALAGLRLRLRAHDAALANGCAPQERRQLARLLARIVGARAG